MTKDIKSATTIDEQVALLKNRGMNIDDEEKAKENLLDMGYFRLGFYWFPFEKGEILDGKRIHTFIEGTNFNWAIKLYYFDFDLRNLLLRYISRIEVNFRTTLIYHTSNKYKRQPFWYVDNKVLDNATLSSKDYKAALKRMRNQWYVKKDCAAHGSRKNPPAWKAFEFIPFGFLTKVYEGLKKRILAMYDI